MWLLTRKVVGNPYKLQLMEILEKSICHGCFDFWSCISMQRVIRYIWNNEILSDFVLIFISCFSSSHKPNSKHASTIIHIGIAATLLWVKSFYIKTLFFVNMVDISGGLNHFCRVGQRNWKCLYFGPSEIPQEYILHCSHQAIYSKE